MACPLGYTSGRFSTSIDSALDEEAVQDGENKVVEEPQGITYGDYLKLDVVLNCLEPESEKNGKMIHDEHLFVIQHQTYELWFKQIIFEIDSIRKTMECSDVGEGHLLTIVNRLQRVNLIINHLADQFKILETMKPLDFRDFRDFLSPASGFQSLQFRLLENKLGVNPAFRVKYNKQHYKSVFRKEKEIEALEASLTEPSLLLLVQRWLERTPGLEENGYNFWPRYQQKVSEYLNDYYKTPCEKETDPIKKQKLLLNYVKEKETFDSLFDESKYNGDLERGFHAMSHKAFQGAMMISLYCDEPRFNEPMQLLHLLIDLDNMLSKWRYNHVLMVQRMIGSRVGTGGSSGYQYLRSTVSERYKVFTDLYNLSTFLIPRSYIPRLNPRMKRQLSILKQFQSTNDDAEMEDSDIVLDALMLRDGE